MQFHLSFSCNIYVHFFCPRYFTKLLLPMNFVVFLSNFTWKMFYHLPLSFREIQDFSNRKCPWFKKSIVLLVLLCALILAGVVILAFQSRQVLVHYH